jgi:hypothetical protein
MSALMGLPLHLAGSRRAPLRRGVRAASALLSLGIGLAMVYTIGWQDGLFR